MGIGVLPFVLDNPILNYAWGSRTAIAELLGRPVPAAEPEAELWIGAHPKASSRIVSPEGLGTLEQAIGENPVTLLGVDVCERFGNELPFLLKILAAAEPLSIQAHPDQEQARKGWARQNAEGIPLDAGHRSYRDQNHKPELVCALTPFTALKGFRTSSEIATRLAPVAGVELEREVARLGRERTPAALRALFTRIMTLDDEERSSVLGRALEQAAQRGPDDAAWAWIEKLHARYPGDIGCLSPAYLNLITLAPEEALFLPAGELHAYLEGTAIEIMANSDNVLRGGLTPKNVDLPELLAILTFDTREPQVLAGEDDGPSQRVYRPGVEEFELALVRVEEGSPFSPTPGRGVEILFALNGDCHLTGGDAEGLTLGRGQAVFIPAALRAYSVSGTGRLIRASVPA